MKIFSETDSAELSTMSRDFKSAQSFRSRTLKFVRQSLGFAAAEEDVTLPESAPVITSFEVAREALMTSYTLGRSSDALQEKSLRRD